MCPLRNFTMEKRYSRSDGSAVGFDLTVAPLWQVRKQPTIHLAVEPDITERRRAEQNLTTFNATLEQKVSRRTQEGEESRPRLQAILDGTFDTVFVKDIEGR